jgi:anthranilate synthase component 2
VKALLVDAFDSFAHIIYQYLEVAGVETEVVRSGDLTPEQVRDGAHDFVLLGPGPGTPEDSGHVEIVQALAGVKPVLGVCLGHQAIVQAFGGDVGQAKRLVHGKASPIEHDGRGIFADLPSPLEGGRYHSLAACRVPDVLEVSATTDDGEVMAVRHRELRVDGIQFHPESVLTPLGPELGRRFLESP